MKRTNQKGITLIALIVTIIVLIIIAGISIATLTADNGVLRQTNSAKVESIEGTAREQVKLAVGAMRLAIAEAQALDNSYKASANTSAIQTKLLEVIRADTTALEKDGWSAADDTANSFKIIYAGDDYKNACNDDNAEIVYTITLGQKSIEITNETNATLKDQNGNNVDLDIGGSTGAGTENGSGSGSGSGEGGSGDGSTSYTVSLEVNIPEAGTVEFTSDGHSGTNLNLIGENTLTFTATANSGYEFLGWYVGDTQIGTETTGTYTTSGNCTITAKFQKPIVKAIGLIEDSWEEIVSYVNDGTYAQRYAVGAYKPLDLGTEGVVNMQIAALDADVLSDGSGNAHITWIAKELLATEHGMNDTLTNANGWEATVMRTYLQNDIWALIDPTVQNAIVAVDKTYYDYTTNSTLTCSDKVWIPSYREVFGTMEDSGVIYSELFTDDDSRIKMLGGSNSFWWLRSADSSYQCIYFLGVGKAGDARKAVAMLQTGDVSTYGVALSFCF